MTNKEKFETNKGNLKFEAEKGAEPKIVAEQKAIKKTIAYNPAHLVNAIEDLALEVDNAYFRHPYKKCPSCYKTSLNAVLVHFGTFKPNKLGTLKNFDATIGDVISWTSEHFKGMSIVKGKNNGIYELETSPFTEPHIESAIIERIVIPEKYRSIIGEMAKFIAEEKENYKGKLVKIGKGEYPSDIKEKL